MFHWQKNLSKGWLTFGLVVFLCVPQFVWAASSKLSQLEQRYQQKSTYVRSLYQRRQKQLVAVNQAARNLALLKKQAQRKGLLGIPAKMRLSNTRAAAENLVKKIKRLDRRINKHNKRWKRMRRQLQKLYKQQLTSLRKKSKTSNKSQRLALLKQWQSYHQRMKQLSQDAPRLARRALPRLRVSMDPLDGPTELRQKADVLKDQEDRIKRHMLKLQQRLKKVRHRYTRDRKDQKLAQRVRSMTSDDDLFNENETNPRVTTGARTSERMRNRGTARQTDSSATPTVQTEPKTGQETNQGVNTSPPPTTGGTPAPNQKPGPNTGSSGGLKDGNNSYNNRGGNNTSRDDASAAEGARTTQGTTAQPRLGYGPGASFRGGDPLKPKGTLAQQLKALQLYKKTLQQRALQLRKKQQQFLKRAKKLQKQETRRRRR